jgi:membrane protein DedA with SNARE-associated domain
MELIDNFAMAVVSLVVVMLGLAWSSYHIGKREGIQHFLQYLDSRKDKDDIVKLKLTGDEVEFVQ